MTRRKEIISLYQTIFKLNISGKVAFQIKYEIFYVIFTIFFNKANVYCPKTMSLYCTIIKRIKTEAGSICVQFMR